MDWGQFAKIAKTASYPMSRGKGVEKFSSTSATPYDGFFTKVKY
jgi:hypothetical protein